MKSSISHLIIVFLLCSISAVGFWFWYAAIMHKSAEVSMLQAHIDTKSGAMLRVAAAENIFADIEKDEKDIQNYFVPETGVVSFISDLEEKGRLLGTTVTVLSVSAGGSAALPALQLTVAVKGSFDAVMRTVGSIEHAPYAISIQSLLVGKDAKDGWLGNIKMQVASSPSIKTTKTP